MSHGLGQFKCFSKNSKVPTPLIECDPVEKFDGRAVAASLETAE